MDLDELLVIENEMTWEGQHILDPLGGTKMGEWPGGKHPRSNPGKEVMRQVGQQDQRLLSGW